MPGKITVNSPPTTSRTKGGYVPSITVQGDSKIIVQLSALAESLMPTMSICTVQSDQLVVLSERRCDNASQAKKIQRELKKQIYKLFNHIG